MLAYLMAQASAMMSSAEAVSTKGVLKRFETYEHVYYKNLVLLLFAIILGLLNWKIGLMGLLYVVYTVVIVFLNENFRSEAMKGLEINTFSLLISSSIFIIYGIELMIGREVLELRDVIGIGMFVGAFYLFLDVKVRDFLHINKTTLMYVVGMIVIASIDRPIAKTAFDNEWISPETAVLLRIFVLVFVFYWFGKKRGMVFTKEKNKEGLKSHAKIGFLKYSRELIYNYALIFGSVLLVSLVMNTVMFITFILSGFYFSESRWTWKRASSVVMVVVAITLVSL